MNDNKTTRHNQGGQVVVFVVLSVLSLAMMWMMLINIANLLKDRIMMQNAADCASQSAACVRARGLNLVGLSNSYLGGIIDFRKLHVLWFDLNGSSWIPYYSAIQTYNLAKSIADGQERIVQAYAGLASIAAINTARAQGADGIIASPGTFRLGLKRDNDRINFYNTIIIEGAPVPDLLKPLARNINTWYYLENNKAPKKNIIIAYKKTKLKIFGQNLFGISELPQIMTIAAARPYNKKGPMFPAGQNVNWGAEVIYKYLESADSYDAQLVPVGAPFQH